MIQNQDQKSKNTRESELKILSEKLKSLGISERGGLLGQAKIGQEGLQPNSISNHANNAVKLKVKLTTQTTEGQLMSDGSVLPITAKRTDSLLIERIPF